MRTSIASSQSRSARGPGSSWFWCPITPATNTPGSSTARSSSTTRPNAVVCVGRTRRADGSPPNNWVSVFGGPAWTPRPTNRPVLSAQSSRRAARPQLVERGGCASRSTTSCGSGALGEWRASASTCATSSSRNAALRDNPVATEEDDFEAQLFGNDPSTTQTVPKYTRSFGAGGRWSMTSRTTDPVGGDARARA